MCIRFLVLHDIARYYICINHSAITNSYTLYVGKIGVAIEFIAYGRGSSVLKLRSCNAIQSCNYYYVVYYALLQLCNSAIVYLSFTLPP